MSDGIDGKILSTTIGGVGGQGPQGAPGASGDGPQGPPGANATTIVTPDYDPPAFQRHDTTHLYIVPGRYYAIGPRIMRQYLDPDNDTYWDIASALSVTPFSTYAAGSSSGVVGGVVASSWYTVWMLGNDANSFMVLPFVRPTAVDYNVSNSGKTTITNLLVHNAWDGNQSGFLTADDQWNNFRLGSCMHPMQAIVSLSSPASIYTVGTIEDCINGTDTLILDGDQTEWLRAYYWYYLCPPASTDCLYLGTIYCNSSSQIKPFHRVGWTYRWVYSPATNFNNATSGYSNTNTMTATPPNAMRVYMGTSVDISNSSGSGMIIAGSLSDTPDDDAPFYNNISNGDPIQCGWTYNNDAYVHHEHSFPFEVVFLYPCHFRNQGCHHSSGTEYVISGAGSSAEVYVSGFEE